MTDRNRIKEIVGKTQFELEDEDTNTLFVFSTRQNGDVGAETPGEKDIAVAKQLQRELYALESVYKVEIEEVDEWVFINVKLS